MERPFAELNPLEKAAIFEADSGITRDEMAERYHYSARQVARYLRVSKLICPLKKMLEEERLAFVSAVYVSFLSEEEQQLVYEVIEAMGTRLKPKMAKRLRDQSGELTEEVVEQVIRSMIVKRSTNEGIQVRLSEEIREKYFEGMSAVQIADIVEKAVIAWFSGKDGADV
jgi:ParB family chromosome partitioning protein